MPLIIREYFLSICTKNFFASIAQMWYIRPKLINKIRFITKPKKNLILSISGRSKLLWKQISPQNILISMFLSQLPRYGKLDTDDSKDPILLFLHSSTDLMINISKFSQPISENIFLWRYTQKTVFCLDCPKMVICSYTPQKLQFLIFVSVNQKIKSLPFKKLLNIYLEIFFVKIHWKTCFCLDGPNMEIWT